jgi:hypothetical protein
MLALRAELDRAIDAAVEGLHEGQGWSWAAIGRAAGLTRQGAEQRWGSS